jgi:hypothetical protein
MRLVVLVVMFLIAAAPNLAAAPRTRSSPPTPSDVYLGVACHVSGTNCGRVGIAVWLPRAADHVSARLLGVRVTLTTAHAGSGRYGYRVYWTGFRHFIPLRIHPGSLIRVRITVALRGTSHTNVRYVYLSAGWG